MAGPKERRWIVVGHCGRLRACRIPTPAPAFAGHLVFFPILEHHHRCRPPQALALSVRGQPLKIAMPGYTWREVMRVLESRDSSPRVLMLGSPGGADLYIAPYNCDGRPSWALSDWQGAHLCAFGNARILITTITIYPQNSGSTIVTKARMSDTSIEFVLAVSRKMGIGMIERPRIVADLESLAPGDTLLNIPYYDDNATVLCTDGITLEFTEQAHDPRVTSPDSPRIGLRCGPLPRRPPEIGGLPKDVYLSDLEHIDLDAPCERREAHTRAPPIKPSPATDKPIPPNHTALYSTMLLILGFVMAILFTVHRL